MTMKKFFSMLTFMVAATLSLTSCHDEDVEISYTLAGDWRGDFGMYYDYEYMDHGKVYVETYNCYDSDVRFLPHHDYATYGVGYQVDYYDFGPYSKIYHTFDWEVRNAMIYLTYRGEHEYDTVIRDFRMDNRYFRGYFNNGSEEFKLTKINDFYWDPYWNDFGYEVYVTTRSADTDSISTDGKIIRVGNRFDK